jgi:hypothetical protein
VLLPWAVAGKLTSPHTPVFLNVLGQLSGVQLPEGENIPNAHVALTDPEHPTGQAIGGVLLPWAVTGKLTFPQAPVLNGVAGHVLGVQIPTVPPNAPNEQGALTVPEHPAGQAIAGVLLPWVVKGNVTSPHTPVFLTTAGQLSGPQLPTVAPNAPRKHVALTVPVHPAGQVTAGVLLP